MQVQIGDKRWFKGASQLSLDIGAGKARVNSCANCPVPCTGAAKEGTGVYNSFIVA